MGPEYPDLAHKILEACVLLSSRASVALLRFLEETMILRNVHSTFFQVPVRMNYHLKVVKQAKTANIGLGLSYLKK